MRMLCLLLMVATFILLLSCSNSRKGGARFIPYNPLTFQQDSLKAAGLGVTLSKINEALVIAHPANGGKVKIKNSFNSQVKDKSKVIDKHQVKAKGEGIVGDGNAPVEAKKQAVVGEGNRVEQETGSAWPWVLVALAVAAAIWWYKKYG